MTSSTQTRLALATLTALASLSAHAEPNVTVYGRLNATFERVSVGSGGSRTEVVDNASRIGFKGTEDLGGGNAVIFQIESRVRVDGGDAVDLGSRDSFIGLKGSPGTLRLGRTLGPVYYATYDYISMHNHDSGHSSDALLSAATMGNSTAAGGRMNNTIWYTSPTVSGFTVDVAYALLDEAPQSTASKQTPHHLGIVGAYDQGPLHAALSYASTQNTTNLATDPAVRFNNDRAVTFGGAYNFQTFVLGALYERATKTTLSDEKNRNYFRVAAMLPIGAHEFHANLGVAGDYSGTSDTGAKQYTLAYNYNLSKRTKLYAFYTKIDNDSTKTTGGGGAYSFLGTPAGLDNSAIATGIRHNF
jgi:predicted porin